MQQVLQHNIMLLHVMMVIIYMEEHVKIVLHYQEELKHVKDQQVPIILDVPKDII